jgi:hypothetical protein
MKENKVNGIGDSFDDFLKEQGIFEEVKELAAKKIVQMKKEEAKRPLFVRLWHRIKSKYFQLRNKSWKEN